MAQITWSSAFLTNFQETKKMEKIPGVSVKESGETVVGGVVRDNQGRLLLAFGTQINQPLSVVHGKLLAIRKGVKLIYEKSFRDVHVLTDSFLVVQAVTADQENLGHEGLCAKDIKRKLKKPVVSNFFHVSRSANRVAHNIACFASSTPHL
ncbi:uncharacterized protein [Henckelia pumila]|uniref:uncharacterized protein n=1 Tax=Henckelia pumila TaxID=405737 RepID=UPI003C6E3AA8